MKKLLIFILGIITGFALSYFIDKSDNKFSLESLFGNKAPQVDRIESIKRTIIERERADIPLKIQQFEKVYGITIDSMVITNHVQPYSGYLITTWDLDERQNLSPVEMYKNGYKDKYVRKKKEVYVEINNITPQNNGHVTWKDNWSSAYYSVRNQE